MITYQLICDHLCTFGQNIRKHKFFWIIVPSRKHLFFIDCRLCTAASHRETSSKLWIWTWIPGSAHELFFASLPFSFNVIFSHLNLTSSQLGRSKWQGEACRILNELSTCMTKHDKTETDSRSACFISCDPGRAARFHHRAVPYTLHDFWQYNTVPLSLCKP